MEASTVSNSCSRQSRGLSQTLTLAIVALSLIGVAGCWPKIVDQARSLQGTRTEELRDWVRNDPKRDKLLVFVHGFNSSKNGAWGQFLDLLKTDDDFAGFNLHRFGYRTAVVGQSTDIEHEGEFLASFLKETLPQYRSTVLIGHSMGGLVILHALLTLERDAFQILSDTDVKVVTFGTPYQGVKSAGALAALFNNEQAKDMEVFSHHCLRLRENWEGRFNRPAMPDRRESQQIPIFVYSGTADEFVDEASARGAPGPIADRGAVDGDHLSIVKPNDREHLAYRKLKSAVLTRMPRVPLTTQGKIGIWVARIMGDDPTFGAQRFLRQELEAYVSKEPEFQSLVEVRELPMPISGGTLEENTQRAEQLGKQYNASIILWGETARLLSQNAFYPAITVVGRSGIASKTGKLSRVTEASLEEQLLIAPPGTVRLPPEPIIEPLQLVRFIMALTYVEQHRWVEAAYQLEKFIAGGSSHPFNTPDAYFYFANTNFMVHQQTGAIEPLTKARDAWLEALKDYQKQQQETLVQYAKVQNNLGLTYTALARRGIEPWKNFQHAMNALEEAARFFKAHENDARLATVKMSFAQTYYELGGYGFEPEKNLERAVKVLEEAAALFKAQKNDAGYADAQNNLGLTYSEQARRGVEPKQNFQRAIDALEEAAGVLKGQNNDPRLAKTKMGFGLTYFRLAESGFESEKNLERAVKVLEEAADFFKTRKSDAEYADVQNILGLTYCEQAHRGLEPKRNFRRAVEALEEAASLYATQENKSRLAVVHANSGVTYYRQAEGGFEPEKNFERAVKALEQAADLFKSQENREKYRLLQDNLRILYYKLAERGIESEKNLKRASELAIEKLFPRK